MRKSYTIKGASDSVLMGLWRTAVRNRWHNQCAFHGYECSGELECHHLVRRSRPHLRYDPRNGVLLCQRHHAQAPTGAMRRQIEAAMGHDQVDEVYRLERMLFPDFLRERGQTRREYLLSMKAELQRWQDGVPADAGKVE